MRLQRLIPGATVIVLAVAALAANRPQTPAANGSEISLLQNAYTLLSTANHDYDGHRVKAMKSVRAAAMQLRVSLQGEMHGNEQQATSDAQLRQAQKMLQQVRSAAAERKQRRLVKHLDTALEHLSAALAAK
jgi:hypothetical protein